MFLKFVNIKLTLSINIKLINFYYFLLQGRKSELISYIRPDGDKPKLSEYDKCDVQNSDKLNTVLTRALGIFGIVRKTRHLFLVGQTRIHVDNVTGLGSFMELEVQLIKYTNKRYKLLNLILATKYIQLGISQILHRLFFTILNKNNCILKNNLPFCSNQSSSYQLS